LMIGQSVGGIRHLSFLLSCPNPEDPRKVHHFVPLPPRDG
jgi:hypothetical protein